MWGTVMTSIQALEGLEVSREEKDLLRQIWRETELESHEEVVVKAIKELKQSMAKSVISSEWSTETDCYVTEEKSMSQKRIFAGKS